LQALLDADLQVLQLIVHHVEAAPDVASLGCVGVQSLVETSQQLFHGHVLVLAHPDLGRFAQRVIGL
jgi:hypothetical protein